MNEYMNPKNVTIGERSNKNRNPNKPWQTDDRSELWNTLCTDEKQWLKCKDASRKRLLKTVFIEGRKRFDRLVQKCKRQNWQKSNLICQNHSIKLLPNSGKLQAKQALVTREIIQSQCKWYSKKVQFRIRLIKLNKWKSTLKNYTHQKKKNNLTI